MLIRAVRLLAVLAAAWFALVKVGSLGDAESGMSPDGYREFSDLVDGYDGPPVKATIGGPRTRAGSGACLVLVRDASSSMTGIDPSGQVVREVAVVAGALARSGASDNVGAVVFSDSAGTLLPGEPDTKSLENALLSTDSGGTNFTVGFSAAAAALERCPAVSERHVLAVTDGISDDGDIATALDRLRGRAALHLVVLNLGNQWSEVDAKWSGDPVAGTVRIDHLSAGIVARAVAATVGSITGQIVTTGFG